MRLLYCSMYAYLQSQLSLHVIFNSFFEDRIQQLLLIALINSRPANGGTVLSVGYRTVARDSTEGGHMVPMGRGRVGGLHTRVTRRGDVLCGKAKRRRSQPRDTDR